MNLIEKLEQIISDFKARHYLTNEQKKTLKEIENSLRPIAIAFFYASYEYQLNDEQIQLINTYIKFKIFYEMIEFTKLQTSRGREDAIKWIKSQHETNLLIAVTQSIPNQKGIEKIAALWMNWTSVISYTSTKTDDQHIDISALYQKFTKKIAANIEKWNATEYTLEKTFLEEASAAICCALKDILSKNIFLKNAKTSNAKLSSLIDKIRFQRSFEMDYSFLEEPRRLHYIEEWHALFSKIVKYIKEGKLDKTAITHYEFQLKAFMQTHEIKRFFRHNINRRAKKPIQKIH